MRRGRYIGVASRPPQAAGAVRDLTRRSADFRLLLDQPGLTIAAEPSLAAIELAGGVVLGDILTRDRSAAVHSFSTDDAGPIRASGGSALIEGYWGSYVAALADPGGDGALLVKAPFGDLPCYFTHGSGITAFASDVRLLQTTGLFEARPDAREIARHLAQPELRWGETCLSGLRSLPGGASLRAGAGANAIRTLWSPWRFAAPERQFSNAPEAAARLRESVSACVAGLAAPYQRSLLLLSGGLDSSIVAAALAAAGGKLTCLNLVDRDPAGDERRYARQTADAVGAPLVEVPRRRLAIDLMRSGASGTPYPSARSFTQEADLAVLELSREVGAEAVFDGGGGDNVFYGLLSVAPLADCLLTGGFNPLFWSTARALADLAQTGLWRVAARAAHRAWLRSARPRLTLNTRFLSPKAREALVGWAPHPWLTPPSGTLPGKASQVALLAPAQGLVEAGDTFLPLRAIAPLLAQPIVETCLGVPSWFWFAPGWNRAVARQAFRDVLPPAVIDRRSKGTPNAFVAALFEANRPLIREMLLGGWLTAQGLLDLDQARKVLDTAGPTRGFDFARIMELVDAEAWARSWD